MADIISCSSCNNALKPGAKFCAKCGTKVVVERRCASCKTLLEADDLFCPECGVKFDTAGKATTPEALNTPNAPLPEIKCYNTFKDSNFVIMGDKAYFLDDEQKYIYSVSLNSNEKAKLIFDGTAHAGQYNDGGCVLVGLYCWDGVLYFGENIEIVICSYEPSTNKFTKYKELTHYWDRSPCFCEHFYYYIVDNKFVTVDIMNGNVNEMNMPKLFLQDWVGSPMDSDIPQDNWNDPIVYNGYVYTSVRGLVTHSLRFPINNTEAYELLPYDAVILRGALFAAKNNTLVLTKHNTYDTSNIRMFSLDLFEVIAEFNTGYFTHSDSYWMQYDNILLLNDRENSQHSQGFFIDKGKVAGKANPQYSKFIDAIKTDSITYALGSYYSEDTDYSGLALYKIPNDKLFKRDTNLDDYACPLF